MSYRVESHCNTSQISLGGWGADGGCKQISKVKQTFLILNVPGAAQLSILPGF